MTMRVIIDISIRSHTKTSALLHTDRSVSKTNVVRLVHRYAFIRPKIMNDGGTQWTDVTPDSLSCKVIVGYLNTVTEINGDAIPRYVEWRKVTQTRQC